MPSTAEVDRSWWWPPCRSTCNRSREITRSDTISAAHFSACFKPLNRNVVDGKQFAAAGVCDNLLQAARKSLILKWRDVRVVEGARLESEAGHRHQRTPTWLNAHEISDLTFHDSNSGVRP
jgi:hypothetical protein